MKLQHIDPETSPKTTWSGGTTTQLAIDPPEADYGARDFLWRVSSATVDLEESDFTALPDYDRWISVLNGGMHLTHGDRFGADLQPGQVYEFDGGIPTHSVGRCRDFNLMVRKGACTGKMQQLTLSPGESWILPSQGELVLYVRTGSLHLDGEVLSQGMGARIREPGGEKLTADRASQIMVCTMEKN